jgi:hypothetical protein
MAEAKFKYHLNHHVSYQPQYLNIADIAKQLQKYGISPRTFERDKAIRIGDSADIPGERLMIYSKFFDVPLAQLFAYDLKVKPIDRREPTRQMKKVMNRTGLTTKQ